MRQNFAGKTPPIFYNIWDPVKTFDIQLIDQWTKGPMDQWTDGPIEQWIKGPMAKKLLRPYDRVSDVVENGGCFASKILTHNRMHWHWSKIANLKANMPRIQNMYNMYRAKVDRLAGKNYFLQKMA